MTEKNYYSHLYEIASYLNRENSLRSALNKALQKTAEILELETGWIWLIENPNKSVYLAASHNLPPALADQPERLSGWCYCIKQYLADDIDQGVNISEIACSRLEDLKTGTKGLKFHATIPIVLNDEKVGILNVLSKDSRKLSEEKLTVLNTISELVGASIQRTRLHQSCINQNANSTTPEYKMVDLMVSPQIERILNIIESEKTDKHKVVEVLKIIKDLQGEMSILRKEAKTLQKQNRTDVDILYPETPLTKRELEVLSHIKKGMTNEQIGKQLFITKRTVKFHVTTILSKLNAHNRTEAVDIGLKRGFLDL